MGNRCICGQGDPDGVCWFYKYRLGKGRVSVKTIRKMCLECMSGPGLVRDCWEEGCPLHPFRMGTNPRRKGVGGKKEGSE